MKKSLLTALFTAVALATLPLTAHAAETALSIPFSVSLVDPAAGGTTAAPGPAKLMFNAADGKTWPAFNQDGNYAVPTYDSDSDPARFHGVKYPREKFSLFYEQHNVFTLDGAGHLHFYVRPDCAVGPRPCLPPGSYLVTAAHGFEYNTDTIRLGIAWDEPRQAYRAALGRQDGTAQRALDFRLGHVIDSTGYLGCDFHQHPGDADDFDPRLRVVTDLAQGVEVFAITAHDAYRYYRKVIADLGVSNRIMCLPSIELSTARGHLVVLPQYGAAVMPGSGPYDPFTADCPPATFGGIRPLDLPVDDTAFATLRAVERQRAASGHPIYFFAAHPDLGYLSYCFDERGNLSNPSARRSFRPEINGYEWRRIDSRRWMALYNQGYRFSRVLDSDSHNFMYPPYTGNFVRVSRDTIPPAAGQQALADDLVRSLLAGRSFMSVGPFVELFEGATEVSGSTLTGARHELTLRVSRSATGSIPKTALVAVNGEITPHPLSYTRVSTPAGPRQEAELGIPLTLKRDAWVTVMAGDTSFSTNAVWIDADGDGTITPLIPLPRISDVRVSPAVARPGDQVTVEFRVTPAPREVQAWVAPNDPLQNPACAKDPDCDREAICRPLANGITTDFRCTYRVSGKYPRVERPGPNEVRIAARGSNGYWGLHLGEVAIEYPDTDGDGMDDAWEVLGSRPDARPACRLDPRAHDAAADPDGDGLSNREEKSAGTNPCLADTDGDGIRDGIEARFGCSSPVLPDTDRDGLCDGSTRWGPPAYAGGCVRGEDINGDGRREGAETSACSAETDGDGMDDTWERKHDTCLYPSRADADADPDNDGLTNLQEYRAGSVPCVADTDGDGLNDGREAAAGTDWDHADSDSDGVKDGDELAAGTDPLNWDSDGDGLSDWEEKALGTNPKKIDTDGDGVSDGVEVHENFTSPLAR